MLTKSFIHVPGLGKQSEQEIWASGITHWEDFLKNHSKLNMADETKRKIAETVAQSIIELEKGNLGFFCDKLPRSEYWRVYEALQNKCCFVDIETTGLSKQNNIITVIGLYDGKESQMFVNGKNLDKFKKAVSKYQMVITYNGATFDLPFIRAKYPTIKFPSYHVDLRYPLGALGYRGGLKKIEKDIGIGREECVQGIDGFEAVRLWKAYEKGDKKALKLLLDYNKADIENFKPLMEFVFEKMKSNLVGNLK